MKNLLLVLALLALPLAAQDQKKEEPKQPQVQKLFVLKYADPNQVSNLIRPFTQMVTPNTDMHALAVSATPDAMSAIEDAIKRLDVPTAAPQNVELTVYLLVGSQAEGATLSMPKDLDSVLAQLKSVFTYRSYKLGDVLTLRGRTGKQLETSGSGWSVHVDENRSIPVATQFSVRAVTISPDGMIHMDGLRASNQALHPADAAAVPGSAATTLNTDLDIKEGQKVVVGKMAMNPNEALFLVLMARVAQ